MLTLTAPPHVYRERRARLAAALSRPLVILAGYAPARNYATNPHPFRAGSTYLYFGGPPVEAAAWVIEPGSDGDLGCTLLRPPAGPDDALWFGELPQDAELAAAAGVQAAALSDIAGLEQLLGDRLAAVVCPPHPTCTALVRELDLEPAGEAELLPIIDLRLLKDEHELAALRRAAGVSVEAHRAMLAATAVGRNEADVEAAFHAVAVAHGCTPSFTPIVTVRGEVLHGHNRCLTLQDGALLLADAGVEEPGGYAGDITRTYPVNGRFTPLQRSLYEAVLGAQRAGCAACVPGKRFREIHELAARVLCAGLVNAGLLRGDAAQLAERGAHTLFFPHGLGHLLGLDAHDMEDFGDLAGYAPGRTRPTRFGDKYLRLDRDLEPGMVVTIEPGFYMVPAIWRRQDLVDPYADALNRSMVDGLLRDGFGGIRIEDDIHVTPTGPENLTAELPTDAETLAALVSP